MCEPRRPRSGAAAGVSHDDFESPTCILEALRLSKTPPKFNEAQREHKELEEEKKKSENLGGSEGAVRGGGVRRRGPGQGSLGVRGWVSGGGGFGAGGHVEDMKK